MLAEFFWQVLWYRLLSLGSKNKDKIDNSHGHFFVKENVPDDNNVVYIF